MNKITLIELEWNCYNGFIFSLLHLELFKPVNIDHALFGVYFSKNFFYLDFLFMHVKIFENYT